MNRTFEHLRQTLASRETATGLVLLWALVICLWVIPFEFAGTSATRVHAIVYGEPFFRVLYAVIALYTAVCVIARIATAWQRSRRSPSSSSVPVLPDDAVTSGAKWNQLRVASLLRQRGFSALVDGDGWMWGARRRWSALAGIIFHSGVLVLMASGVLAPWVGRPFTGEVVVAEGETFEGKSQEWMDLSVAQGGAPKVAFTARDVDVDFRGSSPVYSRLAGDVTDDTGRSHRVTASSPWMLDPSTSISLQDFGYTVSTMSSAESTREPEQTAKLKTMGRGLGTVNEGPVVDSFIITVGTKRYRVHATVYGDYAPELVSAPTKSHALKNPRLLVSVNQVLTSGAEIERVPSTLVRIGQAIEVPGGSFSVTRMGYFGVFRVTRVPETPFIVPGVLMLVVGSGLRLLWPRQEVTVQDAGTGIRLIAIDDTYKRDRELEHRLVSEYEESVR